MPCYKPRQAYVVGYKPNGKLNLVHGIQYRDKGMESVDLPCSNCIGCRLEYSRQWAVRMVKEAKMREHNSFITLTYNNEHLPSDMSLKLEHYQEFMKKLRKKYGAGISFYHCGEYGDTYGRPHYHSIIFGINITDKVLHKRSNGFDIHTSETLSKIWGKGFVYIGDVSFASAAYVARYVMKKRKGKDAKYLYGYSDLITGEVVYKKPEYSTMSRRPGIANSYFLKYMDDIYSHDEVVIHNSKGKSVTMKPPKYFDRLYDLVNPDHFAIVKKARIDNAKSINKQADKTLERLIDKERHKMISIEKLTRQYDMEN